MFFFLEHYQAWVMFCNWSQVNEAFTNTQMLHYHPGTSGYCWNFLWFICCNFILIARCLALIEKKLMVLKRLTPFSTASASGACISHTCLHCNICVCLFIRHGFSTPQTPLSEPRSMSFDLFCQSSCSSHSCFLTCLQSSPPTSPREKGQPQWVPASLPSVP